MQYDNQLYPLRKYRYLSAFRWLTGVLLLLSATIVKAQSAEDSFRHVLAQKNLPFEKKHDATVKLAQIVFFNKGWQEGLEVYRQAVAMARPQKDGQYLARSFGMMSLSYYIMSDTVTAYKYLDSALYYVKRTQSPNVKTYILYCKGWLEVRGYRESTAILTLQAALNQAEKIPEQERLRYQEMIYGELNLIYLHWYDMANIEKYSRLTYQASLKLNNVNRIVNASQGMGSYFINVFRNDTTKREALDSALYYMQQSLSIAQTNRNKLTSPSDIPFAAMGISSIFLQYFPETEANLDSINYYNKIALEEGRRTQQFAVEASVYSSMGSLAFNRGNYDEAITYFDSSINTSMKDVLYDRFNVSEAHRMLAEAYERKNDLPTALDRYKEYMKLYKEVFDITKMNSAKDLEAKYEIAQKEKLLLEVRYGAALKERELIRFRFESGRKDQALLAAQYAATLKDKALLAAKYETGLKDQALTKARYKTAQREQELKAMEEKVNYNKKLKKIYSILTIAGFLMAAFLFYAYQQRSKALAQEKKLHELEMDGVKQEHRISMLSAMLEGQEQERTRLARDLHDGLGGLLSGIKIELSELGGLITQPPQQTIVTHTLGHLDHAVDELRRIARSMMPEVLLRYGLGEAVKEYCIGLERSGVPVACQVYNYTNDMVHSRQITLYRIMQELVNNAVKHAGATQILVQLQQSGSNIFLTVEDDGHGFDTAHLDALKGAGLANIQARIEMLQGKIEIQSASGTGVTFAIECSIN